MSKTWKPLRCKGFGQYHEHRLKMPKVVKAPWFQGESPYLAASERGLPVGNSQDTTLSCGNVVSGSCLKSYEFPAAGCIQPVELG